MTVTNALLSLLGGASVASAPDTPETRNSTLIAPGGPAVTSAITAGALQHASGGLVQATNPTPLRLIGVVGLDASLRGIARVLLPMVNAAGAAVPLTDTELTYALYAYNAIPLAVGNSAPTPAMPQMTWQVGQHLTLPVEVGPAGNWVTDLARLRQWGAQAPPAQKQWGLDHAAAALTIPSPETTTAAVTALLTTGNPNVATLASTLRTWLLNNPYEHVFDTIELFRQCRTSRAGDIPELVIACCEGLAQQGLQLSAWGTGGNVALRRFWRLLAGNVPATLQPRATAVRTLLAGALGLVSDGAGGWQDYTAYGPNIEPREPPLTPSQARKTSAGSQPNLTAMALGRAVAVGEESSYKGWVGPNTKGTVDPVVWLVQHPAVKSALGPPNTQTAGVPVPATKVSERMDVAVRIAGNEGFLDACRAKDAALLSAGMQQWSAHNDEELTVLLERFRVSAEDHYDAFFGVFRLQTALSPNTSNPFATNPATPAEYFPDHATFLELKKGLAASVMPIPSSSHPERRRFFGAPDATPKHFGSEWCARVRLAALCSTDFRTVQLQTAAWRFTRIDLDGAHARRTVTVAGQTFTLDVLLASTYAAAIVLDVHINMPANVPADLTHAAVRTHGAQPLPAGGPDSSWLRRFATNFMAVRRFTDSSSKAARDRDIHALLDASSDPQASATQKARGLSPDPGSFTGLV